MIKVIIGILLGFITINIVDQNAIQNFDWGGVVGGLIGGIVAYLVAKIQVDKTEEQFKEQIEISKEQSQNQIKANRELEKELYFRRNKIDELKKFVLILDKMEDDVSHILTFFSILTIDYYDTETKNMYINYSTITQEFSDNLQYYNSIYNFVFIEKSYNLEEKQLLENNDFLELYKRYNYVHGLIVKDAKFTNPREISLEEKKYFIDSVGKMLNFQFGNDTQKWFSLIANCKIKALIILDYNINKIIG